MVSSSRSWCSICKQEGGALCTEPVCEFRAYTLPEKRVITVKRKVKEWSVEIRMTVLKYVDANTAEEAFDAALEDTNFVRVLEREILNVEDVSK